MSLKKSNHNPGNEEIFLQKFPTIILIAIAGIFTSAFLSKGDAPHDTVPVIESIPIEKKKVFGFASDDFHLETITIRQNQFLANILEEREITYSQIQSLVENSKDIFSVRSFRSGKDLTFLREDECDAPKHMIYEPNPLSYIKYTFGEDSVAVNKIERDVYICTDEAYGRIESSLSHTMSQLGLGMGVISKMEDALASSVDFYHLQKGDEFKIIYEEIFIDGEKIKQGNIHGAYFRNAQGSHYAVFFENEKYSGFYDMEGHPTKGAFLRAPVKFSRISSGYNPRRFHPIKKRTIPHLGTDYAAPTGTPIMSVSDGVVTKVSYTKNNGKYVKIKHDKTYETQYLHMNGFASGIKKGVKVKQGQTIGYVGSTGLATGPHVCFRFWKNGRQINHRRENFPPADPLPQSDMVEFNSQADSLKTLLDSIDPLLYMPQSQTIEEWGVN